MQAGCFVDGPDLIWISTENCLLPCELPTRNATRTWRILPSTKLTRLPSWTYSWAVSRSHTEWYRETKRNTLIIFDELINIADKSSVYARFLAMCRHYGVVTINMFQTFRATHNWDGIKGNCQTLVLFKVTLASNSVISQVCNVNIGSGWGTKSKKENWLYRLFTDVVMNRGRYAHLIVDMRASSTYNPTRFRSQTANPYT